MSKHSFIIGLTGDQETPTLDNLSIPASSFSLRRTTAGLFLSVVTPGFDLTDSISNRFNGYLFVCWYQDGSLVETMANVALTNITPNDGARSQSITLAADISESISWTPISTAVVVEHVLYRSPNRSGGNYTYQLPCPYPDLMPGVTVQYGTDSFELGDMQLEVSGDNLGVWLKEA